MKVCPTIMKPILATAFCLIFVAPAIAQTCLHEAGESPEQIARRRAALNAARTINNIQFNRPESQDRKFLAHGDLATAPFAARMKQAAGPIAQINLTPSSDILPGWALQLDVTPSGYWFEIFDKTDPCGFRYVSNQSGLIFTAQPIR